MSRGRQGFALIVVLWAIVTATTLAGAGAVSARDGLGAARNRQHLIIASWKASGCAEAAMARLSEALWPDQATPDLTRRTWERLDAIPVARTGCSIALRPRGLRADVNTLSAERMRALLITNGLSAASADSLADAVMDWRDADDVPRPNGAERQWYVEHGLPLPRNDALRDIAELRSVRGFGDGRLETLLGVDRERVLWRRAPRPVLASLPGMNAATLDVFERHRAEVSAFTSLGDFPELPQSDRLHLARNAGALALAITDAPEAWILEARAAAGTPATEVRLELHLMLADRRLIVTRRKASP